MDEVGGLSPSYVRQALEGIRNAKVTLVPDSTVAVFQGVSGIDIPAVV